MEENQNVEWKTKWRDEYLKWICGFANAQGGKIYIGTADDGTIVGVGSSPARQWSRCRLRMWNTGRSCVRF